MIFLINSFGIFKIMHRAHVLKQVFELEMRKKKSSKCDMLLVHLLVYVFLFVSRASCVQQGPQYHTENGSNHTLSNSSANTMFDKLTIVPISAKSEKYSTKLKWCSTGTQSKENTIKLPIFHPNFEYILETQSIEHGPFQSCPYGGSLTGNVTSVSINEYKLFQAELGEPHTQTLRYKAVILNNGYLSVGHGGIHLQYYAPEEFCVDSVLGSGDETTVEAKFCPINPSRTVIRKCCPLGMVLGQHTCEQSPTGYEWDAGFLDYANFKPLSMHKVNPSYTSDQLVCDESLNETQEVWKKDSCNFEFHPLTDNSAVYLGAYRNWERLAKSKSFCFERQNLKEENETVSSVIIVVCSKNDTGHHMFDQDEEKARISYVYMVCMYIGAFFHLLTTSVYLITWSKQNIHGRTLCFCTTALFFMTSFMGTAHLLGQLGNNTKTWYCIFNSIGAQYFMIASFTWLLVVNIDLWWTFRSLRTDASKSLKRLLSYSLLGWGFPLVVIVISVILNFTYECRTSMVPIPEYGERYCFVIPWAQGYYVYYILSVLIALSCILAVITLTSLYSFKKETSNLRSSKRNEDKQTVFLFLKLGVVMGLTWIFEVISWAVTQDEAGNHPIWVILDLYNALSAILIFIIFVCKRTTLTLLEQTHPIFKGLTPIFSKLKIPFTGENSSYNTASTGATGVPSTGSTRSNRKNSGASVKYTKSVHETRSITDTNSP